MMETSIKPHLMVAENISLWLASGIVLDSEVLTYINTTFSHPTWPELQRILCDASDCELDSLLDLIFYPNESMQIQLESCLEKCAIDKEHEERVIALLHRKIPKVRLFDPDKRQSITIDAPAWAIALMVERLHLTKRHHPMILKSIHQFIPDELQNRLKVCLRNKQRPCSEAQASFLSTFIEKSAPIHTDFWDLYRFLVGFLDEIESDEDFYVVLVESKRSCHESLQTITRLEAQYANSNMETMLMQGIRIPFIDKQAARRRLAMIDNICYTVFGRVADFGELISG
jgi:hypothetical protein